MITQGSKAKKIDVKQGSDLWLALRKQFVCASEASAIMGMNPWCSRQEVLERKLGLIPEVQENDAMRRGKELEPLARSCAEKQIDELFIPEVYVSKEYAFMCASYDGVSLDKKKILEVKCANKKNHELAKKQKIPDYYRPQIQHQISILDIDFCYYYSFDGDRGIVVQVARDEEFIKKMIEMEWEFYEELSFLRSR
jgi:putative phage-type endonuclease